jgi:GT2 family glycosyltransferase
MSAIVGAVAIGRNEGERLVGCLRSLSHLAPRIVYVDSGSSDGSVDVARSLGAEVELLATREGFTAARARNRGLKRLRQLSPDVTYVQFVDGDCELVDGWLSAAIGALEADPGLAVVCGRRRERYPHRSVYNRLCDLEWNTPVGETRSCGGDALMRVESLLQVGGYNDTVIAGEEPELCVRLRQAGWRIRRLDIDMTFHDAAMTRISQWAKRSRRSGHAFAEAVAMHGRHPERHGVRASQSIWLWGLLWPLAILILVLFVGPVALVGLLVYPLMSLKISVARRRQFGEAWRYCLLYGVACVAAKWPQLAGQLDFLLNRLRGRQAKIIEYKRQPS